MTLRSTNTHKISPALFIAFRFVLTFISSSHVSMQLKNLIALRTFRFISPSPLYRDPKDITPYLLCSCQSALPPATAARCLSQLCKKQAVFSDSLLIISRWKSFVKRFSKRILLFLRKFREILFFTLRSSAADDHPDHDPDRKDGNCV